MSTFLVMAIFITGCGDEKIIAVSDINSIKYCKKHKDEAKEKIELYKQSITKAEKEGSAESLLSDSKYTSFSKDCSNAEKTLYW